MQAKNVPKSCEWNVGRCCSEKKRRTYLDSVGRSSYNGRKSSDGDERMKDEEW